MQAELKPFRKKYKRLELEREILKKRARELQGGFTVYAAEAWFYLVLLKETVHFFRPQQYS